MARLNFYRKKSRKIKTTKFILVIAIILGVGFISYEGITFFINGLYSQALSADKSLLEKVGISLSNSSQAAVQMKLDNVIQSYSNMMSVQSQTLYQVKEMLNGVNKFHSMISFFNDLTSNVSNDISISDLSYTSNSSTLVKFSQFRRSGNSTTLILEEKAIEGSGYTFSVSSSNNQSWYKAYNETISVGESR